MHWSAAISLACLVITATLATWGVFSRHFHDTLGQTVGLSIVATACYLRIAQRLEHPTTPEILVVVVQIGLAIFALATAWKLWRLNQRHHDRRKSSRDRRMPRPL